MVLQDIHGASTCSTAVYETSDGGDGFVSVEVAPDLAHDGDGHRGRRPRTCTSGSPAAT